MRTEHLTKENLCLKSKCTEESEANLALLQAESEEIKRQRSIDGEVNTQLHAKLLARQDELMELTIKHRTSQDANLKLTEDMKKTIESQTLRE